MPTDTFVNLYELLQVPPTADADAIREAIKRQRKTWQKRQNAPDPSKRAQAEEKMRRLDEAHRLLLNPASRSSYDQQLANYRPPTPTAGPSAQGSSNWLERAQEFLTRGDAHSAAYAAKQATEQNGANHEAWALRAEANFLIGDANAAIFEYNEALRIKPDQASYQFDLGTVYEATGQWGQALGAYERAAAIEPATPLYRVAVASVYLQNDQAKLALPIMERVVAEHPDVDVFAFYLAAALHDTAIDDMTLLSNGSYVITTAEQANRTIELLSRAKALPFDDPDLRAGIDKTLENARKALRKKVSLPFSGGTFFCIWLCLLVVVIGMWASSPALGLLGAVALIGLTYVAITRPGYKVTNKQTKPIQVKR